MLFHKADPGGYEEEHYFVDPALFGPIRDELKLARVFVCYSFTTRSHWLWVVKVTPENSWYESLASLFKQSREFLAGAYPGSSDKEVGGTG